MKGKVFFIYFLVAVLAIGISGGFASTGIVKDDPERKITIPDERLIELKAKLAYNGEDVFWRFEWDAGEDSSIHQSYLVYRDGKWQKHKTNNQDENRFMEDRFAMMLDDGSVEFFEQYGGFITATSDMNNMLNPANPEETKELLGKDYVRKFLPETRYDKNDWRTVKSKEDLDKLVDAGYFLDLWHWKAHRSNPIGYVDDNWVREDRKNDEGKAGSSNWDEELEQPKYMFDPNKTNQYAMEWDKVINRHYTTEDYYYLAEDIMVEYDPQHEWKEGDVLPELIVSPIEGGRADIFAQGVLLDGKWHLDMQRAMDTGKPREDKIIRDQGKYTVAFAIHRNSSSRYHLTSFPFTIGFNRDAEIEATYFEGKLPPWDQIEWTTIKLFYPGQITWDHAMNPEAHAGGDYVQNKIPLKDFHTEDEFSYYGVESEFRSEILNQWLLTMGAVSLFVILFSFGVVRAAANVERSEEE
ncbi:ethylbenzene dehydrogenase-related protein [Rubeoparvulum massiliense]|uniref:ethylbenzene dehydrogenase-related protein n=1 Tax=Rubeoparvulum massiliense TaxID=1631346 RepID=UPI00065E9434|nr:ethylbenzene dehydrogenase-related protein [Rubeoparvulum massiliense]